MVLPHRTSPQILVLQGRGEGTLENSKWATCFIKGDSRNEFLISSGPDYLFHTWLPCMVCGLFVVLMEKVPGPISVLVDSGVSGSEVSGFGHSWLAAFGIASSRVLRSEDTILISLGQAAQLTHLPVLCWHREDGACLCQYRISAGTYDILTRIST